MQTGINNCYQSDTAYLLNQTSGESPPQVRSSQIPDNLLSRFQVARLNSSQLKSTVQLGQVLRCERAYNSTQLSPVFRNSELFTILPS
jgi:hypothetical protein